MLTGWKTIIVGLLLAVGTPALAYLGGIDWTAAVGSKWAVFISGAIMIAMRFVTKTPVGK